MKNILILNSSPRKNGNSEILSKAVAESAADANTTLINLRELNLNACKGCYACQMGKGNPCIQKDDMNQIYDKLKESDAVVFATPLYWMAMNAEMKNVIDRMFAMVQHWGDKKRQTALIVSASSTDEFIFSQIEPYFTRCIAGVLQWEIIDIIKAGGLSLPGDAEKSEHKKTALKLGEKLSGQR